MRIELTRKLCPLLSLLLTAFGCGKKINPGSSEDDTSNATRNDSQMPSSLVLVVDTNQAPYTSITMSRNALIFLPQKLRVSKGNGIGKRVTIKYNVPTTSADYEYKCEYASTTTTNEIPLVKCIDSMGYVLSELDYNEFPLHNTQKLVMELQGTATGLVIEAVHLIDWK